MDDYISRFKEKIELIPGTDCHIWTASTNHCGYGTFYKNGKNNLAHRISYEINIGPVPKGMFVCHKCDVPPCVNPDHLFIGTAKDNNLDMYNKKRDNHRNGEAINTCKLKKDDVIKIRLDNRSNYAIAKDYNVCSTTIDRIKNKRNWKHV